MTYALICLTGACAGAQAQAPGLPIIEVHTDTETLAQVGAAVGYLEGLAGCALWASIEHVPNVPHEPYLGTNDPNVVHVWVVDKSVLKDLFGDKNYIGYASWNKVWLTAQPEPEDMILLIMHELGHILGLGHVKGSTIMDPSPLGDDATWLFSNENQQRVEGLCRSE